MTLEEYKARDKAVDHYTWWVATKERHIEERRRKQLREAVANEEKKTLAKQKQKLKAPSLKTKLESL